MSNNTRLFSNKQWLQSHREQWKKLYTLEGDLSTQFRVASMDSPGVGGAAEAKNLSIHSKLKDAMPLPSARHQESKEKV